MADSPSSQVDAQKYIVHLRQQRNQLADEAALAWSIVDDLRGELASLRGQNQSET